jgi:hypothetical protein
LSSKYLNDCEKQKTKLNKNEEIKKLKGSLSIFVVKKNQTSTGKYF